MPLPENNILFYWTAPNGRFFLYTLVMVVTATAIMVMVVMIVTTFAIMVMVMMIMSAATIVVMVMMMVVVIASAFIIIEIFICVAETVGVKYHAGFVNNENFLLFVNAVFNR